MITNSNVVTPEEKRTVAVLGASGDRKKFGNKAVRAFSQSGWTVWPIHPKEEVVEGLGVFRTLEELPGKPDWISVYLPSKISLGLVESFAKFPQAEIWLNPGAESEDLVKALEEKGLQVRQACSVVAIGLEPDDFE